MRWQSVLLVVALVGTAGCSSFGGLDTDRPTETVTPAPVPAGGDTTTVYPPGLSPGGISNTTAVTSAHQRALDDRSYTLIERSESVTDRWDGTTTIRQNETITIDESDRFRHETRRVRNGSDGERTLFERETYGNESVQFVRRNGETSSSLGEDIFAGREKFAYETAFLIGQYLTVTEDEVSVIERNETRFFFVRGTGGKPRWSQPVDGNVTYSVLMLVERSGLIRQFHADFQTDDQRFQYNFWYTDVGNTTVERPEWVTDELNRTR